MMQDVEGSEINCSFRMAEVRKGIEKRRKAEDRKVKRGIEDKTLKLKNDIVHRKMSIIKNKIKAISYLVDPLHQYL